VRILVAEDDRTSRVLLERTLRRWGHEVVVAEDGEEAWQLYQEKPFGIVVTDWMMPRRNGLELCRAIRSDQESPYTMVILLTVREDRSGLLEAFEAGVDDFVTKPFDPDELRARLQVGERVVRLERELEERIDELDLANRKMKRDLAAAARIQEALLPSDIRDVPGVHFAWAFRPCEELAGDTFNVFPLGEGAYGLYVLDVSGHGVASALMSVTLSRLLSPIPGQSLLVRERNGKTSITPPAKVLGILNDRFPIEKNPGGQYFTICYGVFDLKSRRFTYSVAGHPAPIWQERNGEPKVLSGRGLPIGFAPHPEYETREADLSAGGRLILYSDGLYEANSEEYGLFGMPRVLDDLAAGADSPIEEVINRLEDKVVAWSPTAAPDDDVSVIAIEIEPGGA